MTHPRASETVRETGWLGSWQGFRVDSPENGRIGFVAEVRFRSRSQHAGALAVTAGLFRRRLLIVPLEEVAAVFPKAKRIALRGSVRLLATEWRGPVPAQGGGASVVATCTPDEP